MLHLFRIHISSFIKNLNNVILIINLCIKKLKFHPYKVKLVQELNEDEPDRRLEFCDLMMEKINANFLFNIVVFLDKTTFELNDQD